MAETLTLVSERVDDMPVLLAHLARLGLQPLLDEHFPTHGNGVGLSLEWVSVLWLTHILSEGDHRLNHVPPGPNSGSTRCRHAPGSRYTPWMSATTDWPRCWRP
jgi:hypothetical protein